MTNNDEFSVFDEVIHFKSAVDKKHNPKKKKKKNEDKRTATVDRN
jgi:hypothetical protein